MPRRRTVRGRVRGTLRRIEDRVVSKGRETAESSSGGSLWRKVYRGRQGMSFSCPSVFLYCPLIFKPLGSHPGRTLGLDTVPGFTQGRGELGVKEVSKSFLKPNLLRVIE